jgi:hypothetical protein
MDGPHDITNDAEGLDRIGMEGFAPRVAPGNPLLREFSAGLRKRECFSLGREA